MHRLSGFFLLPMLCFVVQKDKEVEKQGKLLLNKNVKVPEQP